MTDNVHQLIKMHIQEQQKKNLIAIDATLGNGFDLEFLNTIKEIGTIYGFDIQQIAIETSMQKVRESAKHIRLIQDSHACIDNYVTEPIDLAVFNLGYLPGGDKEIVTKVQSSLAAIDKVLQQLADKGLVVIMTYPGHEEGLKEHESIRAYVKQLHKKELSILELSVKNVKKPCPTAFLIINKLYK